MALFRGFVIPLFRYLVIPFLADAILLIKIVSFAKLQLFFILSKQIYNFFIVNLHRKRVNQLRKCWQLSQMSESTFSVWMGTKKRAQ